MSTTARRTDGLLEELAAKMAVPLSAVNSYLDTPAYLTGYFKGVEFARQAVPVRKSMDDDDDGTSRPFATNELLRNQKLLAQWKPAVKNGDHDCCFCCSAQALSHWREAFVVEAPKSALPATILPIQFLPKYCRRLVIVNVVSR